MGFRDLAKAERSETLKRARNTRGERLARWLTDWHKPITAVAAVAALVFAGIQSCQTREQFELGQRAWLNVVRLEFPPREVGQWFGANVVQKNTGLTPAADVSIQARVTLLGQQPTEAEIIEGIGKIPIEGIGVVPPGVENGAPTRGVVRWTQEWIDRLKTGEVRIFVFGRLTYKDFSGSTRQTRFCAHGDGATMRFCTIFNSAD